MVLCDKGCIPCCDFCIHADHDFIQAEDGSYVRSGPSGCDLHEDEEHQNIAIGCGYCDDFHCFNVKDVIQQ